MKKIIILLTFFCAYASPALAEEKPNIAVADFGPRNVSASDAVTISDFFRIELVNVGLFNVLERNNMEMVLAEQKFQLAGCTDQRCAVQMGKLLNAQKVIVGSVSKLEEYYYISAQVIDIESGKIQYSDKVMCKKQPDLPNKAEELARSIALSIHKKKTKYERFDFEEKRKKYGVEVFAITPTIGVAKKTYLKGQELTVTIEKMTISDLSIGAGLKIYPLKNVILSILTHGGIKKAIDFKVLFNNTSTTENAQFEYAQTNNLYVDINYMFRGDKNIRYLLGLGIFRSTIRIYPKSATSIFYTSGSSVINFTQNAVSYSIFDINRDVLMYSLSGGIEYEPYKNIVVLFQGMMPITTSESINNYYTYSNGTSNSSGNENVYKLDWSLGIFKTSIIYLFNI